MCKVSCLTDIFKDRQPARKEVLFDTKNFIIHDNL